MEDEVKSPALEYMTAEARSVSDMDAIEQIMEQEGIYSSDKYQKEIQNQQAQQTESLKQVYTNAEARTNDAAHTVKAKPVKTSPEQRAAKDEQLAAKLDFQDNMNTLTDVAIGVGAGFRGMGKNIYNGVVDVVNKVVDFDKEKARWTDPVGAEINGNLSSTAKIAKGVTDFVAPIMAIAGTGGGALATTGASAAYNFLAIDPKEAKLQDHLKGTFLKNVPVVADILEGISTKPDDTEMEGRMKNVAMGLGIDAAIAGTVGLVYGASKVYGKIATLRTPKAVNEAKAFSEGQPLVSAAATDGGGAPIPEVVDNGEQIVKDLGISAPAVSVNEAGAPQVNIASSQLSDIIERYNTMYKSVETPRTRVPMTAVEREKIGQELATQPEFINKLATWTPEQGPLKDTEVRGLEYLRDQVLIEHGRIAEQLVADPENPILIAQMAKALDTSYQMDFTKWGTSSEAGASLGAEKLLASALGTTTEEAIKVAGQQGRQKLYDALLNEYGGADNVRKIANNINLLKKQAAIAKIPDDAFLQSLDDTAARSTWMKVDDAVTKVALNGMLSSPAPVLKSLISNSIMTTTTAVENYIAVLPGLIRGDAQRKTVGEATAHLSGLMDGFLEAFKPAWKVIKTGEATSAVRQELREAAKVTLDRDDIAFKAIGAHADKNGVMGEVVDALALKRVPVRVLMGVDTFFNHMNTKAYLRGQASRLEHNLVRSGVEGEQVASIVDNFLSNPPKNVLREADQFAKTTTFAKDLTGLAEKLNDSISASGGVIPFKRVIIPFFKTKANMVEEVVERSVLAPLISSDFKDAWRAGGRSQDEALAKVVTGTTVLGGLTYLAMNGRINGAGTDNVEIDRAMRDNKTVALPTSIKVGDKWVALQGIDPLASMVNAAHFMSKASGYLSEEEYSEAAVAVGAGLMSMLSPDEATEAMYDAMAIYRGEKDYKDRLAQIPPRFTPAGALLTDIRQTVDPRQRQTSTGQIKSFNDMLTTLKMKYQNQIPYFSKDLPAQRNFWAEELDIPDGVGPDAVSFLASTDDAGMKMKGVLERMDDFYEQHKDSISGVVGPVPISLPSRLIPNKISGQSYRLTPREYGVYQKFRAGVDPLTNEPLIPNEGTLKQQFYAVLDKHKMFDRDVTQLTPMEYAQLHGELSERMAVFKEIADAAVLVFSEDGKQTVEDKIRLQAEKSFSVKDAATMGGVN